MNPWKPAIITHQELLKSCFSVSHSLKRYTTGAVLKRPHPKDLPHPCPVPCTPLTSLLFSIFSSLNILPSLHPSRFSLHGGRRKEMEIFLSDYRHGVESKPWFLHLPSRSNGKIHLPKCRKSNRANGQGKRVFYQSRRTVGFLCTFLPLCCGCPQATQEHKQMRGYH